MVTPGGRHGIDQALARDDDGGGGLDSRIRFTLPHDGIYVIRVNPVSSGEGRYVLELESSRGWDDRDRWDDRDDGEDERLGGVWKLTRTGLRPSPNAGGPGGVTLRISADGRYRLRRSGDVDQGRLVRFRPRGADRGERAYLLEGSRDELYLTVRGGERRLIRRSDERVVAQGRRGR